MFPHLVQGLERSLPLDPAALEYFHLHINLDVEHGKALEESLLRWATTVENQEDIRSLEARAAFWAHSENSYSRILSPAARKSTERVSG
jgi:pyrroloquinoline quinone (PQQ) biosynthesis protein C